MYYVYIYLDPRKPGIYRYRTEGGKRFKFGYEPIYVGKGVRARSQDHVYYARKGMPGHNPHFTAKLTRILSTGNEPIILILGSFDDEAVAYRNEGKLILAIGRCNLKNGPLCNLTNGGEGVIGRVLTESQREALSQRERARCSSPEQREIMSKLSRTYYSDKKNREAMSDLKRQFFKTPEGERSTRARVASLKKRNSTQAGRAALKANNLRQSFSRLQGLGYTVTQLLSVRNYLDSLPRATSASFRKMAREHGITWYLARDLYYRVKYVDLEDMLHLESTSPLTG